MLLRNHHGTKALLFAAFVFYGCGGDVGRTPGIERRGDVRDEGEGGAGPTDEDLEPACLDGEVAPCEVSVVQGNGVTSCWEGTMTCVNQKWSPCVVPL